jgi:hypothetical protein
MLAAASHHFPFSPTTIPRPQRMKKTHPNPLLARTQLVLGLCCLSLSTPLFADTPAAPSPAALPPLQIDIPTALAIAQAGAFPTAEPKTDFAFHLWSWEAFVWATALDTEGVPRFLHLKTPANLNTTASALSASGGKKGLLVLKLATRSAAKQGTGGFTEGAGAIVEADGNMLVGLNGYPVYASVHMTDSYFNTANNNLLITGDYAKNTGSDDYFPLGAAVFKATWMRYDTTPPAGAYTTQAQVPMLTSSVINGTTVVYPAIPQQLVTVNVALVGLHVVGYATGHPEFIWGTFEHNANAPMLTDNTFTPSATTSTAASSTFYTGGTTYNQVNLQNQNPGTYPVLNATTQKLSPVTQVVQQNVTGGETNPKGPANITSLNAAGQAFFFSLPNPAQQTFANYRLIGTEWLAPNTYNNASQAGNAATANAIGSVNLANSTAETFQQVAQIGNGSQSAITAQNNCFSCHNAGSYTFQAGSPYQARRIAISHVLSQGLPYYGVPNQIPAAPLVPGLTK